MRRSPAARERLEAIPVLEAHSREVFTGQHRRTYDTVPDFVQCGFTENGAKSVNSRCQLRNTLDERVARLSVLWGGAGTQGLETHWESNDIIRDASIRLRLPVTALGRPDAGAC
jgi:hypothetical protein